MPFFVACEAVNEKFKLYLVVIGVLALAVARDAVSSLALGRPGEEKYDTAEPYSPTLNPLPTLVQLYHTMVLGSATRPESP